MSDARTVLLAFDGSEGAQDAIRAAARLLPGYDAVVVTVWEPLLVSMAHHPLTSLAAMPFSATYEDARSAEVARAIAERGVGIARSVGLEARPIARADERDVYDVIVELAEELDAAVIVTGTRGLHGLSAHRGSVSEHVLRAAGRPVLVVPAVRA